MFALLQLHPPPASIPYTGWVARRDYSRKRSSATHAAAAGAAAAKAADGTKENEIPNGMSACPTPWKTSYLATYATGCPVNYNNSFYDYTHKTAE